MLGPELLVDVPAALWNAGAARERATPADDRPKERREDWRAPIQGLVGAFFFYKKRLNDLTKLLEAGVSEFVWEFYSGLGAWYSCTYFCTPGFFQGA